MAALRGLVAGFIVSLAASAGAQVWTNPGQKIEANNLRFVVAQSHDDSAILSAALETAFRNRAVCCGRYSSLVDLVAVANPLSLDDVAHKLSGRHVLPDGRPILVSADFYPANPKDGSVNAVGTILTALSHNQPMLLVWNSHLYVGYGAIYTETVTNSTDSSGVMDTVDQILLFDPSSGERTVFDRGKDDWTKVQGLLTVSVRPSSS